MSINLEYVEHTCIECGCIFYIPAIVDRHRRDDKKSFYCYNGHSQAYIKSTADTLKEEIAKKQEYVTSLLNRVANLNEQLTEYKRPKRRAKRVES